MAHAQSEGGLPGSRCGHALALGRNGRRRAGEERRRGAYSSLMRTARYIARNATVIAADDVLTARMASDAKMLSPQAMIIMSPARSARKATWTGKGVLRRAVV